MKGTRGEWLVLGALLLVMVGVSILATSQGALERPEGRPDPSTYNERGSGSKGLYLWLQELGIPVRRWERPLQDLPAEARVLIVLGPQLPVEEHEVDALDAWVRAGGVLLLADDTVGLPVRALFHGPPVEKFGLRPRLGGRAAPLRPAFPSAYVEGVETIQPEAPVRFQRERAEGWAPLFADRAGEVVAIRRLGRGTVIAVIDPGLFSNARLETAGHARFILNVGLAHVSGGVVLVDEFHHGHGQQDAFTRYLRKTSVPWLLAQGALIFLVLAVARGTRFGPPVPPRQPSRATSLEYVGALGDLYRRAGARRVAAQALAGSLRRRLMEALGTRPGEGPGQLAARAGARLGVNEVVVSRCLDPLAGVTVSDEGLLRYARVVYTLERRLRRRGTAPGPRQKR